MLPRGRHPVDHASDALIRVRLRDGQWSEGCKKFLEEAVVFTAVQHVPQIQRAAAVNTVAVDFPSVSPKPQRGGKGAVKC
jgi:hypothetical protein